MERPILCLGMQQSDVDMLLQEAQAGKVFTYTDKNALKTQIKMYYQEFIKTGHLQQKNASIEQYSNRKLTEKIAQILDTISSKN